MPRFSVQYLASPQWAAKKAEVYASRPSCCECCGTFGCGPLEVHHLTYERLGHELMSDLQILCADCHPAADAERRSSRRSGGMRTLAAAEAARWRRF
jgi:5-methylcytosine-specific restriction endonuclease McrA